MRSQSGGNQSVERAAAVLRALRRGRPAQRVSDLAGATGLSFSTASRILATLEAAGLVQRAPDGQCYELGGEVLSLAGAALNHHPVHREARPVAQRLAWELGLGANLAVRRGGELFYLHHVEGGLAPRPYTLLGQRNPLHATAMGKCLALGMTPEESARHLGPGPYRACTAHTLTDAAAWRAELARVAERGWAGEVEELALGRACVAAPVRDRTGTVVAALSVSGTLSAMALHEREATLGRRVVEAADAVSLALGHVPAPLPPPRSRPQPRPRSREAGRPS
ncbi:IclR family transcriptional regulator [Streptomyces sp. NPDC048172]|uniref:IclR family transcriptional regulator n=1 Tax=Streptomyces sp. NPDC048172 TaxID=3365505 RepID=UPI00371B0AD2